MWNEARHALRGLLKRPGFSVPAALTFALGIGASTTVFTVVEATLLRPLPFEDPDELVVLREHHAVDGRDPEPASAANLEAWRQQSESLEAIGAWAYWGYAARDDGGVVELLGARVSPNLFPLLGVEPAHGRTFTSDEAELGNHRSILISHRLWMERFGGASDVLGRTMRLDDEPYTVVGVMPPGFRFPDDESISLWTPLAFLPGEESSRARRMFHTVARIAPGETIDRVRSETSTIASRLADAHPDTNAGYEIRVTPVRELVVGDVRTPLLVLLGAVLFVLLVACANVAGLILARGSRRRREITVRRALGATRSRIVGLLLLESAILALVGAAGGIALAAWGSSVVAELDPGHLPGWNTIRVNGTVIAWVVSLAAVTVLLAGLVPALRVSRTDDAGVLRNDEGQVTPSAENRRFRQALIVFQTAVSIVLLVGAGLLVRSFLQVISEDPGFEPEGLLAVTLYLPDTRYPEDAQQIAFFERLLERLRSRPEIESAGGTTTLPMSPVGIDHDMPIAVEGTASALADPLPQADFRIVTEGYLETLGLPLLRGRYLDERDRGDGEPVVVVNQTLVDRYLPSGDDPLGRTVGIGHGDRRHRIVGVVADVRHRGLDSTPRPELYVPFRQVHSYGAMELAIRTPGDPSKLVRTVQEEIQSLDPTQPMSAARTVEQLVSASTADRRFNLTLLGSFAALALALTAVGIYAAMAYAVAGRTTEIGIRMALGARFADVAGEVLREALGLTALGVLAGLAGSLALTRLLTPLLYETSPTDPWVLVAGFLGLVAVALLASWIPARRAARLDPVAALRTS